MSTIDRVRSIAEPVVAARGFVLYDIEQQGPVLRVTVTAAEGAPGVDELGEISREISRGLDREDPIAGSYLLEVSSPGLERNLKRPEHFAAALGETVSVKYRGADGAKRVRGTLLASDESGITLLPESDPASELRLAHTDIEKARTVFDWDSVKAREKAGAEAQPATRRSDR